MIALRGLPPPPMDDAEVAAPSPAQVSYDTADAAPPRGNQSAASAGEQAQPVRPVLHAGMLPAVRVVPAPAPRAAHNPPRQPAAAQPEDSFLGPAHPPDDLGLGSPDDGEEDVISDILFHADFFGIDPLGEI